MSFEFTKVEKSEWSNLLANSAYASGFHEYDWNEMIAEQFGGQFSSVVASQGSRKWLLPVFSSFPWLGDRDVQLSAVGYGGPIPAETPDEETELSTSLKILEDFKTAHAATALRTVLYPADFWSQAEIPDDRVQLALTCIVDVAEDPETIFSSVITGNARTAVRKSEKSGVTVRELNMADEEEVTRTLSLLHETQRTVGSSYLTEGKYFSALNSLRSEQVGVATYVAEVDTAIAAMTLCVYNRRELFHLLHGWDRSYSWACANQALQWHMISEAAKRGVSTYNMGESHTPELLAAKLRWGGRLVGVPKISLSA